MKQVIVVRGDVGMSPGKLAAQACHASVSALLRAERDDFRVWLQQGQTKIVLQAGSEEELRGLAAKCDELELPHQLIADAGRTELEPGTVTALGIGPADPARIDRVTGALALLR